MASTPQSSTLRTPALCLAFAFAFAVLAACVAHRELLSPGLFIDDSAMQSVSGHWRRVDVSFYSRARSSYATEPGSALQFSLPAAATIGAIELTVYDYAAGTSTLTVEIDGRMVGQMVVGRDARTAPGTTVARLSFPEPATGQTITLVATSIGQQGVVIDGALVSTDQSTISLAGARLAFLFLAGSLLAIVLAAAARLVVRPSPSSGQNLVTIDLLRGVAVLLVMLLHARGYTTLPAFEGSHWFYALATNGHFGVEIFYVVSAYTLCVSLFASVSKGGAVGISEFLYNRTARIFPLFFSVIAMSLAFRPLLYRDGWDSLDASIVLKNAFLVQIFDDTALNGLIDHSVWWSISTEFQFYIVLPALFLLLFRSVFDPAQLPSRGRVLAAVAIGLVGVTLGAINQSLIGHKSWFGMSLFHHIDAFTIGIAAGLIGWFQLRLPSSGEPRQAAQPVASLHPALALVGIAVCFLILLVVADSIDGALRAVFAVNLADRGFRTLFILATVTALLGLVAVERRSQVLERLPWLRAVGILSYAAYLVHVPVFNLTQRFLPIPAELAGKSLLYFWCLGVGIAATLALSLLLHRLVEMPALSALRRRRGSVVFRRVALAFTAVCAYLLAVRLAAS